KTRVLKPQARCAADGRLSCNLDCWVTKGRGGSLSGYGATTPRTHGSVRGSFVPWSVRSVSTSQPQKAAWQEGVALGLLEELGDPDPPMNAISLARACGLQVVEVPMMKGARLCGDTIEVDAR